MPALHSITVRGFKSIDSIENLTLGAINVIIGPNGVGKSNFIGVFSFLQAIREGRLESYVSKAGGAERLLHFGSKMTSEILLKVEFDRGLTKYELALQPSESEDLVATHEQLVFQKESADSVPQNLNLTRSGREAGISMFPEERNGFLVRNQINGWRVYHFHDTGSTSPMKKAADVNDNRYLYPDGRNLAAFLYYLQKKHALEDDLIRRTVQRVAPFFEDFQLEPMRLNPDKILLEWRHKGSDAYFNAASFSDGTLRFIALATLFLQPDYLLPQLILVDEPELGLHPYAITLLASLVKQASVQRQVILSTQSPILLDHFNPEDVLVADRVDGGTQFTRLDSARLESWLEDYSLGQLWEKERAGGTARRRVIPWRAFLSM